MGIKVATAFSGGFGSVEFALKYEQIEHEVVFAIEWMDAQRKSYLLNHKKPTGEFAKDICDFDGTKYRGKIDYYHLSPPCQSYSLAGRREGANSDKGQLMFEAIKSLSEVQPKMFTIENVAGLLSANKGEDFAAIMRDLKSFLPNYSIQYGKLNAKEMGTPQNRLRVFIIGFRADVPMMPFPLKIPLAKTLQDVLCKDVPAKYFLSQKMLDSFIYHKKRHAERGNGFGFAPLVEDATISKAITTKHGNRQTDGYLLKQIGSLGKNRQGLRVYDTQIASTQNAMGGGLGAKGGLYATPTRKTQLGSIVVDGKEFNVRRLTPREAARCFGDFDDMFNMGDASDTRLYEFIGNAIDINTMRRLIKAMLNHLDGKPLNGILNNSYKKQKVVCSLFG